MRAVALRRFAVATTVLSLALLVTACGGAKGERDRAKGENAPKASASAEPEAQALSVAELEKLIVEQADLKGYKVENAGTADFASARLFSTDPAICKPFADTISSIPPSDPAASARRRVIAVPKENPTVAIEEAVLGELGVPTTVVMLGSYEGDGAQDVFASLKTAGAECAGGFTTSGGGVKSRVDKVAAEPVTAGEEGLAFTASSDLEGEPAIIKLAFFRKGNVLAAFSTISLSGGVKEQPRAVIDAQVAKLG